MKKRFLIFIVLFAATSRATFLFAQFEFFKPQESFAIEVSLPNTGLKRLPIDQNAIASLIVVGDYIVGGTAAKDGLTPFLFTASLSKKEVVAVNDLNKTVAGQQSIQSHFCRGSGNRLFAGTIANKGNGATASGHLLQFTIDPKGAIAVKDLGTPVPNEGIYTLTGNADGTMLYGVSHPSGSFFTYNVNTGAVKTYNDIKPTKDDLATYGEYGISAKDYLTNALIQDGEGRVYGSSPVNRLFYFDPKDGTFHFVTANLPDVWGRRALGRIDAWAKAPDGTLYGGNAGDGQLLKFDPATQKVENLGKPVLMNRLRGLAFGRDGKLYGIAGAAPGYTHLFRYDEKDGYVDLGNPQFIMKAPGIEQGIAWRGFQLRTLTASEDGKYIVMGEDESLSQLLIFAVDEK